MPKFDGAGSQPSTLDIQLVPALESQCKAAWKSEFKLPWCETGPPNHLNDKVASDQYVVKKEVSLSGTSGADTGSSTFGNGPSTFAIIWFPRLA